MRTQIKILIGAALCVSLLLVQGCTKEKAEAIKVAAQNFQAEASAALHQLRDILKQNVALPPGDNDKLAGDLSNTNFTYAMLQFLLSKNQSGRRETAKMDKQIGGIEAYYTEFTGMFTSLPQGNFFGADAVARSEKYAVNLTTQMINLAQMIQDGKIPVHLNAKRILLVEQIRQHNAIADEKVKQELLKNDAQQITALAAEESQRRDRAIAQCLKAAEMGRLVTKLIHEYKTLSAGDVLAMTQQALGFAAEISGQNANVAELLNHYTAIQEEIHTDPYWSRVLDDKLNPTP